MTADNLTSNRNKPPLPPPTTTTPTSHPTLCPLLSSTLLSTLQTHLPPPPSLILSIGSGSGLLEALLHQTTGLNIHGVELLAQTNVFLAPQRLRTVPGSWALARDCGTAAAWLFVYPRDAGLLAAYAERWAARGGVETGVWVWIGPRADWEGEVGEVLRGLRGERSVLAGEKAGIGEYEMFVVARKGSVH